jgi:outer membrane protein
LYYIPYRNQLINPVTPERYYPLIDQITNNQYKQVSMVIQIPFFNRWQVQTNIKKAKIGLQDAEYVYGNAVLEMQKAVQQYHTEALAAFDNYRAAKESVANSDEVYRFAEERFRVGTGTALEMQEARKQLFESTSEMISSRYVLIFYSKILDFYMGKEIVF